MAVHKTALEMNQERRKKGQRINTFIKNLWPVSSYQSNKYLTDESINMEELSFNVLYIEDDIIQRKVMAASRKLLKIQLHSATMGLAELALTQEIKPALLLI